MARAFHLRGERHSQCAACHELFRSTSAFDAHRAWAGADGTAWIGPRKPLDYDRRVCLHPRQAGLYQYDDGAWGGSPMTEAEKKERGWM